MEPNGSSGRDAARGARGAGDRVRRSHAQTRTTLRLALCFLVAAPATAAFAFVRGWPSSQWLVLHIFFAGGVVLAISAVSLMLTVTWAAAPAPPDVWVALQRGAVAVGAAGVAVGRQAGAPDAVVASAGAVYLLGLIGLGVLLVATVRRGVERRFDVAVAAYVAAITAGVVGVSLGIAMAIGASVGTTLHLRDAHMAANVLGLVGLVVGGTLPYFAATVGRSKMAPVATRARLGTVVGWQAASLAVTVAALAAGSSVVATVSLCTYVVGIVATMWLMPRPTRRQLEWSGPRLVGMWAGAAWWAFGVAAGAVELAATGRAFADRWLLVLVVAGYAQILWGSLAYLLPMLRGGGHEKLGAGFAATRSWLGLAAVNLAGLAIAVDLAPVAVGAAAVWILDAVVRAARVGTRRVARPGGT